MNFLAETRRCFTSLHSYDFFRYPCALALGLLSDASAGSNSASIEKNQQMMLLRSATGEISPAKLTMVLIAYDAERLKLYAKNMVDYHILADSIPALAHLYFLQLLPQMSLSYLQRASLINLGLQRQSVDAI